MLVDNKPGASGVIATNAVAKAAAYGHTLFLSWDTHAINPVVMKDLPYDTFKDFVPVTLLARLPLVMGAWGGLPANNLQEFITPNTAEVIYFGCCGEDDVSLSP